MVVRCLLRHGDLDTGLVLPSIFEGKFGVAGHGPGPLFVDVHLGALEGQVVDHWVCLNLQLGAEFVPLFSGAVDAGHVDHILVAAMELLPDRSHLLAVGAPRRKELERPRFVANDLL